MDFAPCLTQISSSSGENPAREDPVAIDIFDGVIGERPIKSRLGLPFQGREKLLELVP